MSTDTTHDLDKFTPKNMDHRILVAVQYEDSDGGLHTCSLPLGGHFPLMAMTKQIEWIVPSLPEGATLKSFAYPEIKYTYFNVTDFAKHNPHLYEKALKAAEAVKRKPLV